jgi:hypothetical protein
MDLLVLPLLLLAAAQLYQCTHDRSMLQYEAPSDSQPNQAAAATASAPASTINSSAAPAGAFNLTLVVDAVRKAMSEPVPYILQFKTEFDANGSSISVAESYAANTLAVQVGASCTSTRLQVMLAPAAFDRLSKDAGLLPRTLPWPVLGCLSSTFKSLPLIALTNPFVWQFRFGACSGTQLHHHSSVELMQAFAGDDPSYTTVGMYCTVLHNCVRMTPPVNMMCPT